MTQVKNVVTIIEGAPLFRKNDVANWPNLIVEGPNGPISTVSTYLKVNDREQVLQNFRDCNGLSETTWLQFQTPRGPARLHVLAMSPSQDSNDHLVLWLKEPIDSPEQI